MTGFSRSAADGAGKPSDAAALLLPLASDDGGAAEPVNEATPRFPWATFGPVCAALLDSFVIGALIGFTSPALNPTMLGIPAFVDNSDPSQGIKAFAPSHLALFVTEEQGGEPWHGPTQDSSDFASFINLGALTGAALAAPMIELIGRRTCNLLATLPFGLCSLWIAQTSSVKCVNIARLLLGVAVGWSSVSVPVYIAEVSPASHRGAFSFGISLAIMLGILLVNVVGGNWLQVHGDCPPGGYSPPGAPPSVKVPCADTESALFCDWRGLSYSIIVPSGLALIGGLLSPESPSWLLRRRGLEQATAALRRLRMGQPTEAELLQLQVMSDTAACQPPPSISALIRRLVTGNCRALSICLVLHVFYQWSGLYGVVFFEDTILADAGIAADEVSNWTNSITAAQIVATVITTFIVDHHFGRRPLLATSCFFTGVGAFVMAACFHNCEANHLGICTKHTSALKNTFLAGLFLYQISFAIGLGSIPWLLAAEFFPYELRNLSCGLCCMVNWGCSYAVTKLLSPCGPDCTPPLPKGIGMDGVFFLFAGVCMAATVFGVCLVPETKARALERIARTFDDPASSDATSVVRSRPVGLIACASCCGGRGRDEFEV